ncbi:hypothetical protein Gotri_021222 [Gossypium trilobum]|uniref:DUF4283 domain-containing protein n=1 Tax=Gossypium trilobum TaxID=34281 RepID=A0A7J9DC92_9ROSI|nr:hypothetical protein [Gossypium trilobum]
MSCGLLFDYQCGTFSSHENTMANLWHPLRGVQISNLGGKCNIFKFFHEVDIVQMKNGAPWTFNNHFLIIHQLKEDEDPMQIPLVFAKFWVQVHDLSSGNEEFLEDLGAIGCPKSAEEEEEINYRQGIRKRDAVRVGCNNPIVRDVEKCIFGTPSP